MISRSCDLHLVPEDGIKTSLKVLQFRIVGTMTIYALMIGIGGAAAFMTHLRDTTKSMKLQDSSDTEQKAVA